MKLYTKEIDGKKYIKRLNEIVLKKDGKQIINPREEMVLEDGWVEYVYVEPEKTIEDYRKEVLYEISDFDNSSVVNEFYIQGIPVWLDKQTRAGLKLRFESELAVGQEETSLWYNDMQFPLPLNDAMQMLYAIEIYASKCYDNTHFHISKINKMDNIEDIINYNYRDGYPEKLNF